jgi:NAD(P)-dependent dehydrogenase (short-subunit alcohol dehydrogenase family)
MSNLFDLTGKVAAVTGGAGVLGKSICEALAAAGVSVAILDIAGDRTEERAHAINEAGGKAIGVQVDVLDKESIKAAANKIIDTFGKIDILINGAGGNKPQATVSSDMPFFDLPKDAIDWVFNLNILGTILPSQIFGKFMAEKGEGVILNVSSMTSMRPLTRVVAYGNAKAAVNNFTQWLAVHLAQEYGPNIRVNAIAPGFFLTDQNRFLLTDEKTGELSQRGQQIIDHTPASRFGDPEDLVGTIIYLVSDAARFVTGIVVPIDGGFSAYSGV